MVDRSDGLLVFVLPPIEVRSREWPRIIDAHREFDLSTGTGVEPQPGVRLAATGENRHHGPIAATEDSFKRLFVGRTRFGRFAGMCMQPEPEKPFRWQTRVDLLIEEVGDGFVVEFDGYHSGVLADQADVFHQQ